ncbi:MAG: ABC transporter substrate-binding protein [Bauldia litoralis]
MSRVHRNGRLGIGISLVAGAALAALAAAPAHAEGAKIGLLGGLTGPIAQPMVHIVKAAEFAIKQVNDQGGILGGKLSLVLADSKCDAQSGQAAANKLVNVDNVTGIVGAMCSGATISAANAVAVPAGVVMISPASTSPAITNLEDKDFVFRTAPTDAAQGQVLAQALFNQGVKKVALTYVNNDYGKGLANHFSTKFKALGGTIAGEQAHEDKKSSYRSELATLSKGGADSLVVIGYPQSSAPIIIRQSLEGGLFKKFVGPEAIFDKSLWTAIGIKNLEGMLYTRPSSPDNPAAAVFEAAFKAFNEKAVGQLFTSQTYDATFMLAIAIQKAGSTDRAKVRDALRSIANGKGEKIQPGEWKKAVALIKAGKEIDYAGASGSVDFDSKGDPLAFYNFWQIKDGKPAVISSWKFESGNPVQMK